MGSTATTVSRLCAGLTGCMPGDVCAQPASESLLPRLAGLSPNRATGAGLGFAVCSWGLSTVAGVAAEDLLCRLSGLSWHSRAVKDIWSRRRGIRVLGRTTGRKGG